MSNLNNSVNNNKIKSVKKNPVHGKIQAMLVCERVKGTTTSKADRYGEKYLATNKLNPELVNCLKNGVRYVATGKVDGTCTLIKNNALHKRRDIKGQREIPSDWFKTGIEDEATGHMIGFMPLDNGDKWHIDCHVKLAEKKYDMDKINVLEPNDDNTKLVYCVRDIKELEGQSVEVMGPKFQNNPHHLKMHCIMLHGSLELKSFPDLTTYANSAPDQNPNVLDLIKEWFESSSQGPYLEGVVLHFENGAMFKIHRHHLDLEWNHKKNLPLENIQL